MTLSYILICVADILDDENFLITCRNQLLHSRVMGTQEFLCKGSQSLSPLPSDKVTSTQLKVFGVREWNLKRAPHTEVSLNWR